MEVKEKLVKQIAALLMVFVLLLGVSACSNPGGEGTDVKSTEWERITVTDQASRDVTISERPQRVARIVLWALKRKQRNETFMHWRRQKSLICLTWDSQRILI